MKPFTQAHPPKGRPKLRPLARAVATAIALGAGTVQGAVIVVDTDWGGEAIPDGVCSLSEAIINANADFAVTAGCAAGSGADEIVFAPGIDHIDVVQGQFNITDDLTITGPAGGLTLDGNGISRIFGVVTDDVSLTISNLRLTNGRTTVDTDVFDPATCYAADGRGGAICALGPLTIVGSSLDDNHTEGEDSSGGAIYVEGDLTITDSRVSGNSTAGRFAGGGGIFATFGDHTLYNSEVSGNSTAGLLAYGGGIHALGSSLTVTDSTVAGNQTNGELSRGGGISTGGGGPTLITNSTISGNSTTGADSDGGGIHSFRGITLQNSTLTGNQATSGAGGLHLSTGDSVFSAVLASTILADNGGPADNLAATVSGAGSITVDATNSLFGDAAVEVDGTNTDNLFDDNPLLAGLNDNGCAVAAGAPGSAACVRTHAILPGSPALDAGTDNALTSDQRGVGFPRVFGPQADIGAFEAQQVFHVPLLGTWGTGLLASLLGLFGLRRGFGDSAFRSPSSRTSPKA